MGQNVGAWTYGRGQGIRDMGTETWGRDTRLSLSARVDLDKNSICAHQKRRFGPCFLRHQHEVVHVEHGSDSGVKYHHAPEVHQKERLLNDCCAALKEDLMLRIE